MADEPLSIAIRIDRPGRPPAAGVYHTVFAALEALLGELTEEQLHEWTTWKQGQAVRRVYGRDLRQPPVQPEPIPDKPVGYVSQSQTY